MSKKKYWWLNLTESQKMTLNATLLPEGFIHPAKAAAILGITEEALGEMTVCGLTAHPVRGPRGGRVGYIIRQSDLDLYRPKGHDEEIIVNNLQARLHKGLLYFLKNYPPKNEEKWQQSIEQWEKLAAIMDQHLKAPPGYTRDELTLLLAWLRGDEESPIIWLDGARQAKLVLTEDTGKFALPLTLKLADGKQLVCNIKREEGDDPDRVWDVLDLLIFLRVKRVFVGANPVLPEQEEVTPEGVDE